MHFQGLDHTVEYETNTYRRDKESDNAGGSASLAP
jgi:hypothetical protein